MKKTMMIIAFAALGLSVIAGEPKATNSNALKVDATKSTFKWHAKKVTGEHFGTVQFQTGEVTIEKNTLVGGTFVMDMSTIEVTDLTGEYHDKLVGHLKSDDFFSVEKNKNAVLKIKSATFIKTAKPGENNYQIKADLTIKGITQEITFPAMVVVKKDEVIGNAEFNIDRTKFDIRYGSKSFFEGIGDKAIDNEFNVKVRIVAAN